MRLQMLSRLSACLLESLKTLPSHRPEGKRTLFTLQIVISLNPYVMQLGEGVLVGQLLISSADKMHVCSGQFAAVIFIQSQVC